MVSRRLTKIQKHEILEAYQAGENTNTIAEKYSCSSNTINRTVKSLLTDSEYKLLKEQRSNSTNKKVERFNNISFAGNEEDIIHSSSFNNRQLKVNEEEKSVKNYDDFCNSDFEEIDFLPIGEISNSDNKLEEIVPLVSNFDLENKKLGFEILNQETLPDSVYMLVDKKVELEVKSISDFPEWSFLPEAELQRNAILLFSNQRSAKRSCSRNQRVIKIPNTRIFKLLKSYLIAKGITRLILEDSIISVDN